MSITVTYNVNEITIAEATSEVTVTPTEQVITIAGETTAVPGPQGDAGADGEGVAVGGTAGQVLAKIDGTDFNTEWITGSSGDGSVVYVQDSQPGTTIEGDQWFSSLNGTLQTYTSTGWQSLTLDGQNF